MKYASSLLVSTLLATALLTACGEKAEEAPAPAPAPEVAAPAPAAEPAPAKVEAGGYEPSAEERVQGITLSAEEMEKELAAARAMSPQPVIPGEEAAAAPAAEAPAAEAPAAEAPAAQ